MATEQKSQELCDKLNAVIATQDVEIGVIFVAILACKHALMKEAGFKESADEFHLRIEVLFLGNLPDTVEARKVAVASFSKIEALVNDTSYAFDDRLNALDKVMWRIVNTIVVPQSGDSVLESFRSELQRCADNLHLADAMKRNYYVSSTNEIN